MPRLCFPSLYLLFIFECSLRTFLPVCSFLAGSSCSSYIWSLTFFVVHRSAPCCGTIWWGPALTKIPFSREEVWGFRNIVKNMKMKTYRIVSGGNFSVSTEILRYPSETYYGPLKVPDNKVTQSSRFTAADVIKC